MTGKQAAIGCALSCAGLLVLALAVALVMTWWLNRPGELIEPERLFAADTTGYVAWQLDLADPGTAGFVRTLDASVREHRARQAEHLPGPLPGLVKWSQQLSGGDLERLFPLAIVWTSSKAPEGEGDLRLLSISLASAGNRLKLADWMLDWMLSNQPEVAKREYAGERIYQIHGDEGESVVTFFLRGNDLFFVTDFTTAERAVARLSASDAGAPRPPTELDRLFGQARADAALRGAVVNERGELRRLWSTLAWGEPDVPDWDEVGGLVLSGDLTEDGAFVADLALEGRDPSWARERSTALVEAIGARLADLPVEVVSEATVEDERVSIRIRVEDLARLYERLPVAPAE